ncbi:MAG TPA: hypothetical protein DCR69_01060 [Clostridium sp.]|nr:hypothetical protein [Clostridium sp.]
MSRLLKENIINKIYLCFLICFIVCGASLYADIAYSMDLTQNEVEINATNFPDDIFREYVKGLDEDRNNKLSQEEVMYEYWLELTSKNISSLKGIEYFTNLKYVRCGGNKLQTLDLSKNLLLKTLDCSNNQLISLDLSKNKSISELNCSKNKLNSLNIVGCSKLRYLNCDSNNLTYLDLSKHTGLHQIHCGNNQLSKLYVNSGVVYLFCNNNKLSELDLSKCTRLFNISCANNQLNSIDLSNKPELREVNCQFNNLSNLNLSSSSQLEMLWCNNNKLKQIEFNKSNTFLGILICNNNNLGYLNIEGIKYDFAQFECTNNISRVNVLGDNSVDLSSFKGFNINKVSNLKGATIRNGKLMVDSNKVPEYITYTYEIGKNVSATFSLSPTLVGYRSQRLSGIGRFETAVAIAKQVNPNKLDSVILVNAYNFPDALSGTTLAGQRNAPILLIGNDSHDTTTLNYLKANLKSTGTVYVLGGNGVITESTLSKIRSMGFKNIKRLGGSDRFATNMAIVNELNVPKGSSIVIANSHSYADSLAISGIAGGNNMPIILVNNSLTLASLNKIKFIAPKNIYIVGGTGVVSAKVENQLKSYGNIVRLGGSDRYATSLKIASYFTGSSQNNCVVAYSHNFPDALAGGALASKTSSPILLVNGDVSAQKLFLNKTNINKLFILGGTGVISESIVKQLTQ